MGRLKTQEITDDLNVLALTISEMMDVSTSGAWDMAVLLDAMTKLPFTTEIIFDKIFGRWIFTNGHEDDWIHLMSGHKVSGPNFSFVSSQPDIAIIKGIHYYYHTRIKQ